MRPLSCLAATAAVLVLLLPAVGAHSAPNPSDQFTRLLADWTDDCGGDGGAATGACRGSDDLIALDVQEAHTGSGDVMVFRFWLDKGKSYPITDTLSVSGKTLAIKTNDDNTFSVASGFDAVTNAQSAHDGTRFTVDATISYASLGLAVGGKLTGFTVASHVAAGDGDFMPGGCHNTIGDCIDNGDSAGQYIAGGGSGSYTLRGPTYYVDLHLTGSSTTQTATVGQDLPSPIMLNLANKFPHLGQKVTLTVSGADGVTAGFHQGSTEGGATYKQPIDVSLDGGSGTILHLNLHGDRAGAKGTLTITATTDQGGLASIQVPYTVVEASSGSSGATPDTSSQSASSSKGSPTLAAPIVFLLLAGLALRRRA